MKTLISLKNTLCLIGCIIVFIPKGVFAQTPKSSVMKKGDVYMGWGWNWTSYTKSDMHFVGEDYNFTLKQVAATDRPTPFGIDPYLNPLKLTIPQTNFRVGYFISDKYSISWAFDHMKYVLTQNQTVKISGEITGSATEYDGSYENEDIVLKKDFLEFEHTDGLNYMNFEINRFDPLLGIENKKKKNALNVSSMFGFSLGWLFPRTDAHLLNYRRNNKFHITGYGAGVKAGLNLSIFTHFFIQTELKGGFINMPNVKATIAEKEHVEQKFYFLQRNILLGFSFPIKHSRDNK